MASGGLGRGLGSLIPSKIKKEVLPAGSQVLVGESAILDVEVGKIKPNPHQPRRDFSHEALEELILSIKEHGILQPLIASRDGDRFQLIAGERRLRAAEMAGLTTVPLIVRQAEEQQQLELALVENIQRRNLNPIEEAVSYQRLIDEFNLTQEAVAKRAGKSRTVITNNLRLLALPTEIQKALVDGKISYSTARVIVGLPAEKRLEFFRDALKNDLTVRAVEGEAKKVAVRRHFRKVKDPELQAHEEALQQALGTKVSIKKTGSSGSITIEFYSDEELAGLLAKFERAD